MTDPDRGTYVEDVLFEFAAEPVHDRATLERYLKEHPTLVAELLEMSLELELQPTRASESLPVDEAWVDASWKAFVEKAAPTPAADPFAKLTSAESVALRKRLNVPSAVMQGFRSRLVDVASVPERFIGQMAEGIRASVAELTAFLSAPARLEPRLSYKSDKAPSAPAEKISFEQLLRESKVDDEQIQILLSEGD